MSPKQAIDQIVKEFFHLFTTKDQAKLNLDHIYTLCIPQATIIKNVNGVTEIYDLHSFITPRKKSLTDGSLTDFSEYEIQEHTKIFGHIAQRFCVYEKTGILNGEVFKRQGMKSFQFIQTKGEWKINSVIWDDENEFQKIDIIP